MSVPEFVGKSFEDKLLDTLVLYEKYRSCNFSRCRAGAGLLLSGRFYDCRFNNAKLIRVKFGPSAVFINCDFSDVDFTGSSFNAATFEGCRFNWAEFKECTNLFSTKLDAYCVDHGAKNAKIGFNTSRGHFLQPEIYKPKAVAGGYLDEEEYEAAWCDYMYGGSYPRVPRDLKAVLVVSDEAELIGNVDLPT